jgi:hypothetical protein
MVAVSKVFKATPCTATLFAGSTPQHGQIRGEPSAAKPEWLVARPWTFYALRKPFHQDHQDHQDHHDDHHDLGRPSVRWAVRATLPVPACLLSYEVAVGAGKSGERFGFFCDARLSESAR